ncbi:MAG: tetratricopeptide repeat protein [Bacteroidota bacterium]|jgi:tetratricopeptide (TPR) repeat protein|nr:MAG: cytochrome C biosynthesis protein [Bacteroidota bacterium]
MAKKKETKKDILESPEALQEKFEAAENWIEEHSRLLLGIGAVVVLAVAGFFGYKYYLNNRDDEAQRQMFQAVYYFESDSLDLALNGDGNNLGFVDIADEYGNTNAGNLANFYAGAAYLKQGKYQLARLYLEDFKANDLLVQARAYSLIGDTYMEEENYEQAVNYYRKAASYKPNKYYTPTYLMKEALACEKLNDTAGAKKAYQTIIDNYWESAEFQNARKFIARLNGNS